MTETSNQNEENNPSDAPTPEMRFMTCSKKLQH